MGGRAFSVGVRLWRGWCVIWGVGVWSGGVVVGRDWIVGSWIVMGKRWGVVRAGVRLCEDRWGARFLDGRCVVEGWFMVG